MIEHRIHHTFWCFNENSGDTGGLVYDNFGKWDEDKYALVKPALWQDDNGKFISLDHTIPLGKNGITVSEYYSGSVTPTSPTTQTSASTAVTETTAASETDADIIYGDVNCDKSVDISDAVLLKCFLINSEKYKISEKGKTAGDVHGNKNGLNAQDAVCIQKKILGMIKELPV